MVEVAGIGPESRRAVTALWQACPAGFLWDAGQSRHPLVTVLLRLARPLGQRQDRSARRLG